MCAYECARCVHVCVHVVMCERLSGCVGVCALAYVTESLTACVCSPPSLTLLPSPPPPTLLKALRSGSGLSTYASPQADLAGACLTHYPHFADEKVKVERGGACCRKQQSQNLDSGGCERVFTSGQSEWPLLAPVQVTWSPWARLQP